MIQLQLQLNSFMLVLFEYFKTRTLSMIYYCLTKIYLLCKNETNYPFINRSIENGAFESCAFYEI